MNKTKTLIITALAFALLMGSAAVLYGTLSAGAATDPLTVLHAAPPAQAEPEAETRRLAQDAEAPKAEMRKAAMPAQAEEAKQEAPEDGKVPAPDFTVYDEGGNAVRLTDYIGKPIVLNFWASWCGPCQREMASFDAAYAELGDSVHFLMVNLTTGRETPESAAAFVEEHGYAFPVLYDTDIDAAATYGIRSLPTTYFIDAEGFAVAHALGTIERETLQKGIDMILPQ